MLCNFTYYNETEVAYQCKLLFKYLLHRLIIDEDMETEEQINTCLNCLHFTSIGNASESGGLVSYIFRQEASLSIDRFFFPTALNTTDKDIVICLDDVIVSGGTALRFLYNNLQGIKCKKMYYLTLVTSDEAIERLSQAGIEVIYCSKLDPRNKLFSTESLCFFKFPEMLDYAKNVAFEYGSRIEPKYILGHKDGQYAFGFYYNVPNNCLPIFWSKNNWTPIFERKEKYQNVREINRTFDPFI